MAVHSSLGFTPLKARRATRPLLTTRRTAEAGGAGPGPGAGRGAPAGGQTLHCISRNSRGHPQTAEARKQPRERAQASRCSQPPWPSALGTWRPPLSLTHGAPLAPLLLCWKRPFFQSRGTVLALSSPRRHALPGVHSSHDFKDPRGAVSSLGLFPGLQSLVLTCPSSTCLRT